MRDTLTLSAVGSPSQCALIVVDVQNDFCHPDGVVGRNGGSLALVEGMVEGIGALRAAALGAGIPTIFAVTHHRRETNSPAWIQRSRYSEVICVPDTFGCDFYEHRPGRDDLLIIKHRYSAFYGTPLAAILRNMGRETVVVAGINTDVCVESTVRDGFIRDFNTIMPVDATATRSEDARAQSASTVSRYFGLAPSVRDVCQRWESQASDRRGGDGC